MILKYSNDIEILRLCTDHLIRNDQSDVYMKK